jgi:hypothetical protein
MTKMISLDTDIKRDEHLKEKCSTSLGIGLVVHIVLRKTSKKRLHIGTITQFHSNVLPRTFGIDGRCRNRDFILLLILVLVVLLTIPEFLGRRIRKLKDLIPLHIMRAYLVRAEFRE